MKLRGFRIELGEVAAALAVHPEVREAVVVIRPGPDEEPRLVAYVACRGSETPAELDVWLGEHLPAYMVPATFVGLETLPKTPNGKLDRAALPEPGTPEHTAARFVEPRNDAESRMASIWAEVLGLERVGVEDSFFKLGGHSLLATRVIARARRELAVDLELRTLFETPTIAGLMAMVERREAPGAAPARPARIQRIARTARRRPGA